MAVDRRSLQRRTESVSVLGRTVAVKIVTLPGGETRAKPEFEDVAALARESGRPIPDVLALIARAVDHH
jgi:uncharacterized protein (DUF111 family)